MVRIAGPFDDKPYEKHFKFSPLSIREKQVKRQYRLLHNLRFPYDKHSVNGHISKSQATVQYSSIAEAISFIQHLVPACYLAKIDISEAIYTATDTLKRGSGTVVPINLV